MESILFYFENFEYNFKSPIEFCFLSKINPGNYYMEKCHLLIENIFNKEINKIKITESGEGGRENEGYIWNAYKYIEDSIEISFCLTVSYENNDINIKLNYVKSNLMLLFLETLEENLKDCFLNERTIYTKVIKTNIKNMEDIYYANHMVEIYKYFNKPNFQKRTTTLDASNKSFLYNRDYIINNYDIQVQVIVSENIIYIYIDGFKNKLSQIGFNIEDFENYIMNNLYSEYFLNYLKQNFIPLEI
jgi:hypothetical protein